MPKPGPRPFLAVLLLVCIVTASACCISRHAETGEDILKPGDHDFYINVNGTDRHYVVHVPPGFMNNISTPTVIMLHGGGGTSGGTTKETGWSDKADQEDFIAVFPDALPVRSTLPGSFVLNPQVWNDGSGRGQKDSGRNDDIDFISSIIDRLIADYNVDDNRVYVAGFSNGASMTFRAGAELSDRISAIGVVSGICYVSPQDLKSPVPMVYFLGTKDPFNTLKGGVTRMPWGRTEDKPPVNDTIRKWTALLNITGDPAVIYDQGGVYAVRYGTGGRATVDYYLIDGMGHTWPGGTSLLPEFMVGPTSDKINATDVMWEFFRSHPKP